MTTGSQKYGTQVAHAECEKHVAFMVYPPFVIKGEIEN